MRNYQITSLLKLFEFFQKNISTISEVRQLPRLARLLQEFLPTSSETEQ